MIQVTKEKIKDIVARAGKTFVQAFIGSISVDSLFGVTDFDTIKQIAISMIVAAVAAGVSAVWNMCGDLLVNFIYKLIDKFTPTSDELTESIEGGFENLESEGEE